MHRKIVALIALVAAASLVSVAHGSESANRITGTWTGTLTQEIALVDLGSGEVVEVDWSKPFTISVYEGRIVRLYTTARAACRDSVRDYRIAEHWKTGTGPKLSQGGGFTVRLTKRGAIEIAGGLFARSGTGRLSVKAGPSCSGKGTWKLKRRL